jgi:tyrosyl-tRNA synthetase
LQREGAVGNRTRLGTLDLRTNAFNGLSSSGRSRHIALATNAATRDVVDVLKERGLLEACTNEEQLRKDAATDSLSVYCGFDPTADSLHLGNLLGIVVLAWFQRCGHTPIALVGGATGRVGDPSGKSSERPVLDDAALRTNTEGIKKILTNVLRNGEELAKESNGSAGPAIPSAKVMNNLEWFGNMGFLDFLREIGKYARVGTMMAKDSVKTRLDSEQGMSFTEFSYQLLQGYDFCHLFNEHDVRVQVGGSDQWGNITAGTDLIRRILDKEVTETKNAYGVTFPLLLKENGQKFGKSEDGAVWLSGERLSPYKFYQYLVQSTDADVIRFMKMLTFLDLEAIHAMELSMKSEDYAPNTAQKVLAAEVTRFVHGADGLRKALAATEGLKPGSDTVLDAETLEALAEVIPTFQCSRARVVGQPVADVMALSNLQKSKGEAKRLIKGGGARLNNAKVDAEDAIVTEADLIDGRVMLLAAGKKNKMLITIV